MILPTDDAPPFPEGIASKENVCEVVWIGSPGADPARPELLFEIPHGATRASDFAAVRALLSPELPEDLRDFFFVNTDVGSSEYARQVASWVASPSSEVLSVLDPDVRTRVGDLPPRGVLLLRCLIPRTFIDANRVVEPAGERDGMTGAINDYIRAPQDTETLLALHREYHAVVERAYSLVCGSGRLAFMPHTYAPKTVSIDSFDEGIGQALRKAYEPEAYARWETRPEIDLITEAPDGTKLAPLALVESMRSQLTRGGYQVKENASYRLHPVTMGHRYSAKYPGRVLCVEVRRDLLADPFTPFDEMKIGAEKVARVAGAMAAAFLTELALMKLTTRG